jgi:hypothetical protein
LAGWWKEVFWPSAGPALLGFVVAVVLAAVLTFLLPDRIRPLNAALLVLVSLGLIQRFRQRTLLAGAALVQVGLSWLAGYMAFAELSRPSLVLALCFAVAACGGLWVSAGRRGGLWLMNGGLVSGVALLFVLKQPLAAGAVGLLLGGQIAVQLFPRPGDDLVRGPQRAWPWLMISMLVASLAIP